MDLVLVCNELAPQVDGALPRQLDGTRVRLTVTVALGAVAPSVVSALAIRQIPG